MRKQIIPLVVGLGVGFAALKLGNDYLDRKMQEKAGKNLPTGEILVAARDLPIATCLTARDIKRIRVPQPYILPGVCTDPKQVVGGSVKVAVAKETPLMENVVSAGKGFGGVIPPGYLAVAVKVDEYTGVAGFLQPGDRVAVLGTFRIRDVCKEETVTKIVLQNVEVRAVGQQFREQEDKDAKLVRSVTLLVKPRDAERLQLAASSGKIHLALQASLDAPGTGTTGLTLTSLLADYKQTSWMDSSFVRDLFMALRTSPNSPMLAKAKTQTATTKPVKDPYLVEVFHPDKVEQIFFESRFSDNRMGEPKGKPMVQADRINQVQPISR